MFINLSAWLRVKSTGWIAIGTLGLMLLFTILVLPSQAETSLESTGNTTSPDISLYYSPADLYQIAENYGPEGRQAYIYTRWTFDLIFPLVYVSFLALGLSWFSKQLTTHSKIWNLVNLIPLLSGLLDYLENSATSMVMYLYPARWPGVAFLASTFTLLKWSTIVVSFIAYFYFGGAALIAWLKRKKN